MVPVNTSYYLKGEKFRGIKFRGFRGFRVFFAKSAKCFAEIF